MMDIYQGYFCFDSDLLYYIRQNDIEKAQEILKRANGHVSKVGSSGNTLLHYAVVCGNDVMVKYLIDFGAEIDFQNEEGQTPLRLALDSYHKKFNWEEGKQKSLINLLNANANMHICDNQGKSPLSYALARDDSTVLKWFFEILNNECSGNSEKIAEKLIKANSSVYSALYFRNAEVTRILLNSGCPLEPSYSYRDVGTTLQESIRMNDVENMRALLDHGIDPNAESEDHTTPMMTYSSTYISKCKYTDKNPEILQLLLNRGANPHKILMYNTKGTLCNKRMQMYGVLRSGNRESIRVLLGSNLDLNAKDGDGYTALHYLMQNDRPNVLEEFEGRDFDINARCNEGLTPLLYAVSYHGDKLSVNLLKFLLRHSADLNAKDQLGVTTLMHLCRLNFLGLDRSWRGSECDEKVIRNVEYLLQHGANSEVVDSNGYTIFNIELSRCRFFSVKSVLTHLAILAESGTPIKEIIRDHIDKNEWYKAIFQMYRKRLEAMKKIQTYKSLTLHELLSGKQAKIKRYLRKDGLMLKLSRLSNKYLPEYRLIPYYRYAMRERISRIVYSIRLKKEAAVVMAKVTGIDFEGYPIILDQICSYLTQKDLLNFCKIIYN